MWVVAGLVPNKAEKRQFNLPDYIVALVVMRNVCMAPTSTGITKPERYYGKRQSGTE